MNQINNLARHTRLLEIVGDTVRVRAKGRALGGMAFVSRTALLIFAIQVVGCDDKDKEKAQTPPVASTPQPPQRNP